MKPGSRFTTYSTHVKGNLVADHPQSVGLGSSDCVSAPYCSNPSTVGGSTTVTGMTAFGYMCGVRLSGALTITQSAEMDLGFAGICDGGGAFNGFLSTIGGATTLQNNPGALFVRQVATATMTITGNTGAGDVTIDKISGSLVCGPPANSPQLTASANTVSGSRDDGADGSC
jgi:hypothetical protein